MLEEIILPKGKEGEIARKVLELFHERGWGFYTVDELAHALGYEEEEIERVLSQMRLKSKPEEPCFIFVRIREGTFLSPTKACLERLLPFMRFRLS